MFWAPEIIKYTQSIEIIMNSDAVGLKRVILRYIKKPIPIFIRPPNISDKVKKGYPSIDIPPKKIIGVCL